jgi:hypothetical protein
MDPDVITFAGIATVIVAMLGSLAMIGVTSWRFIRKAPSAPKQMDNETLQRLEQLQQSMDSIAIEVERIAEAQRFTARLMAQKPERIAIEP